MKRSSDGKVVVQTKIATADQIESTEISAVSPVHKELSKDFLRSVFRSLESTLLFLSKSKQGSHWDKVVLAFHNLAGFTLERSLFSVIYSLFPQLYKLEWKILPEGPADRQLCVSLDSTFGPAELKVYSAAWIAARDFEFCRRLDAVMMSSGCLDKLADITIFDPSPLCVDDKDLKRPTNPAQQLQPSILAALSAARAAGGPASLDEQMMHSIQVDRVKSLEELRQLASLRGQGERARAQELEDQSKRRAHIIRLQSLPDLCDILRTSCLVTNRTARPLQLVVPSLARDLKVKDREVMARLRLLGEIVPEFLNIVPADHLVAQPTLQVNTFAPYDAVRKKVRQRVNDFASSLD